MTDAEIILKAVKKALDNGYKEKYAFIAMLGLPLAEQFIANDEHLKIIFSHEFAKAFWGEEWPKEFKIKGANMPYYTMELTQLAMEKDRIKYLEKFL